MNAPVRSSISSTALVVILAGGLILSLSIGTRGSFGLFLQPLSDDLGWGREVFALAIAFQNLIWGLFQPLAGMIADRYGSGRVIAAGGLLYAAGVALMSQTTTPIDIQLSAGLLIGMGMSATSFAVVLAAVGRVVSPERRSLAFGVVSALGSLGQLVMVPAGQAFLEAYGWSTAFVIFAFITLLMVPVAAAMRGRPEAATLAERPDEGLGKTLKLAFSNSGYRYLIAGFFVCGFHVMFIGAHLPAYLTDSGLSGRTAALALMFIGLFNVVGSYACGALGGHYSKKDLLCLLYLARSVAIMAFIVFPLTPVTVIIFASAIGFLWLGTVPLTSGIVAQMFGMRYLGTLFGLVFLSHQVGSFLGVWLGGFLFDATGDYTVVWWVAVVLGVIAALLHWPIDEREVASGPATDAAGTAG
jgi:predicted MFS family arabinose efflux permease